MGLIYQEVCCSYISSGIFKIMKIDPRKKWRKADSVSLDRSSTDTAIENYDFRIFRSEIRPILYYLIRVSFLTTLVIYKTYFKSHQVWKQRPRTHILYVKLLCLCALGFCNQVLHDLHRLWSKELCNQQQSFKLLKLVTY